MLVIDEGDGKNVQEDCEIPVTRHGHDNHDVTVAVSLSWGCGRVDLFAVTGRRQVPLALPLLG